MIKLNEIGGLDQFKGKQKELALLMVLTWDTKINFDVNDAFRLELGFIH